MSVFNPHLFDNEAAIAQTSDDAMVMAWLSAEERLPSLPHLALAVAIGVALTLMFSLIG